MSYVQQMGDVSYLGVGPPGFPFVRLRDAAHIAAEADAELDQLRARVAELESKLGGATTMMACKGCGGWVRPRYAVAGLCAACAGAALRARLADAERRLAEAEAQRAVLVAALEDLITRADEADRLLPYGHGLRTLPARQALATQPPSDLVALVKAAATWREAHDRYMDEWSRRTHDGKAEAVHAAVASAIQHETAIKAALDTLLTNQPGFRALIESEGV